MTLFFSFDWAFCNLLLGVLHQLLGRFSLILWASSFRSGYCGIGRFVNCVGRDASVMLGVTFIYSEHFYGSVLFQTEPPLLFVVSWGRCVNGKSQIWLKTWMPARLPLPFVFTSVSAFLHLGRNRSTFSSGVCAYLPSVAVNHFVGVFVGVCLLPVNAIEINLASLNVTKIYTWCCSCVANL